MIHDVVSMEPVMMANVNATKGGMELSVHLMAVPMHVMAMENVYINIIKQPKLPGHVNAAQDGLEVTVQ